MELLRLMDVCSEIAQWMYCLRSHNGCIVWDRTMDVCSEIAQWMYVLRSHNGCTVWDRTMDVLSEITQRNSAFLATEPWAYIDSTFICGLQIKNNIFLVTEPCRVLRSSRRCRVICCFGIDSEVQSHVDKNGYCRKGGQWDRRERQATTKEAATLKSGSV
jgi:hypothetical protein